MSSSPTPAPTAEPACRTIELRLTGQPAVKNRWGSGSINPAFVVLTYLDDRRLAHLHGTWIREGGEQTDAPVDQLYRHDDDWPDWITSLADKHSPQRPAKEHVERRTTWPQATELQQAADTLRNVAPDITGPLAGLAEPVADWLEATANALAWLAPFREHEPGYPLWEVASNVARTINGTKEA